MFYLDWNRPFRSSDHLFVTFSIAGQGSKATTISINRWILFMISISYSLTGTPPLECIQGRSHRGMAACRAEIQGDALSEICRSATGASSYNFVNHYCIQNVRLESCLFGKQVLSSILS